MTRNNVQKNKLCQLHQDNNLHNTNECKVFMSQADKTHSTWMWDQGNREILMVVLLIVKCKQNDECTQQCEQETHLTEFQPTVKIYCPTDTKPKANATIPMVEDEAMSVFPMDGNLLDHKTFQLQQY
jgi:hypothetical protein